MRLARSMATARSLDPAGALHSQSQEEIPDYQCESLAQPKRGEISSGSHEIRGYPMLLPYKQRASQFKLPG